MHRHAKVYLVVAILLTLVSLLMMVTSFRYANTQHHLVAEAKHKYNFKQNELDYYRDLHHHATGYNINTESIWLKYH